MSISASYLILAVLTVRFLLRKAPKTMRSFLWLLVGIRLLVPFSIESAFSLIPDTRAIDEPIYSIDMQQNENNTAPQNVVDMQNQLPTLEITYTQGKAAINQAPLYIRIGTRIWIAGIGVMLAYMFISWLKLSKRVSTAVPLDFAIDDEHNTRVYQSEMIESPFLFGIIRPRIYIPSCIAGEDIPYVIMHEKMHMKRKDYLIKPIGFLVLSVYWFNPFIWVAYIMLCKDVELICDELVVRKLGIQCKKAYSQALLTSAVNRRMIAACPFAFGEIGVKERVKNVLNYKKPAFWVIMAAVLACIIVPICFMTQKKDMDEINLAEDSIEGEYYMDVSERGKYISVPKLSIAADGTFTFSYDVLSSYLPHGTYTLKDNILKAETADGAYHYQFTVTDEGYLVFNAGESSDVSQTGGMDAPVQDGAGFTKTYPVELLNSASYLLKNVTENQDQKAAMTDDELKKIAESMVEMENRLASEEEFMQELLNVPEKSQQEQELLQKHIQELKESKAQIEAQRQIINELLSRENVAAPYAEIEKWARAFCDKDADTIIKLANDEVEQDLEYRDLLISGNDYTAFGWSSPWPWGDNNDESVTAAYRIINVSDRSAEILYYAWVSDPHVTVWREQLTFKMENDTCIITSESLEFMDGICTLEEFERAYPDQLISGTMMDYTFNGAGESLNNNAKANRDNWLYEKLFSPDTAAVYLLNLLDNPNKAEVSIMTGDGRIGKIDTGNNICIVTVTFLEDGSSVTFGMCQPYGADGIWLPCNNDNTVYVDDVIKENDGSDIKFELLTPKD